MQTERMIVKEVLQQESFSRAGQAPTLKQSVVFLFPTRENKMLLVTFYGDKVREAMVLRPGDEVEVGFVLSSSCSAKGFWGTYVTGVFIKILCRTDDAPIEALEHEKMMMDGEASVKDSLAQLGIENPLDNINKMDDDDLPF